MGGGGREAHGEPRGGGGGGGGVGWGAVLWESSQSVFRTAIGRVTDNAKQTNS